MSDGLDHLDRPDAVESGNVLPLGAPQEVREESLVRRGVEGLLVALELCARSVIIDGGRVVADAATRADPKFEDFARKLTITAPAEIDQLYPRLRPARVRRRLPPRGHRFSG